DVAVRHDLLRGEYAEVAEHVEDRHAERGDELEPERDALTGDRVPARLGAGHAVLGVDGHEGAVTGGHEVGEVLPPGAAHRLSYLAGQDRLPPRVDGPSPRCEFRADALFVSIAYHLAACPIAGHWFLLDRHW